MAFVVYLLAQNTQYKDSPQCLHSKRNAQGFYRGSEQF